MRPYLAILTDAFREARSSRVLWILLGFSILVLAALSGFSLTERAAATVYPFEIWNPRQTVTQLAAAAADKNLTAQRRIWELLPLERRQKLRESLDRNVDPEQLLPALVAGLNHLLTQLDLPGESDWPIPTNDPELDELRSRPAAELSAAQLARLNRLLLEAALPTGLNPGRERELVVGYFGMDIPTGAMPPLGREFLIRTAVGTISGFFLGYLGLFIGLIVTSSLIPQTFEPGALDLLLSKPVNRAGVYLCKYLGGCMFVLINSAVLLCGLWLLVGLRHDIWIGSLVWCVPIFLFWFMVFFAVTALVGLIWRNSIVATGVGIGLWAVCALLSFAKNQVIEGMILEPARIARLDVVNGEIAAVADTGQVFRRQREPADWVEILTPDDSRQFRAGGGWTVGPCWTEGTERLLTVQRTGRRWNSWLGQSLPLVFGEREQNYRRLETNIAPTGTVLLARDRQQRVLAVALNGIYRLNGSLGDDNRSNSTTSVLGWKLPFGQTSATEFIPIAPTQRWVIPVSAAIDPVTEQIAVMQRGEVQIFTPQADGTYRETARQRYAKRDYGLVGWCGKELLLGFDDGVLELRSPDRLADSPRVTRRFSVPPRGFTTAPDGSACAVVMHDRSLWTISADQQNWAHAPVTGQGDISAAFWEQADALWVVDRGNRATCYDPSARYNPGTVIDPPANGLTLTHRWVLRPLYMILPKTGETWNLVNTILTDERTYLRPGTATAAGLSAPRAVPDIVTPLVTHAIWIVVLLSLGCLYIHRHDY